MLCGAVVCALLGLALGFHSVDPPKQDCVTRPLPYGPCSASCGGGVKSRQLQIVKPRIGYGRACPPLSETVSCNEQPCAVDCQVQTGEWSQCSASCGQGTQTKLDQILIEASNGGRPCPSEFQLRQTRSCQPQLPPCPVPKDCVIGYTQYSQCSRQCGGGTQTRTAFIVSPAENGGAPCPADMNALSSSKPCNQDVPCAEPKDCELMQGEWGQCSANCGQGIQKRVKYIVSQPENGGRPCPTSEFELVETRACSAGPCPQPEDCLVQFPPFSQCTRTCGGGVQQTTGQIVKQASAGGAPCPTYGQLTVQRSCGNTPCIPLTPVDCDIEYGTYSQCSAPCGGGFQSRKGYIKKQAENGGQQCPAESSLIERIPCNQQACAPPQGNLTPVDCDIEYGTYSQCSAPCGGGFQSRKGYIKKQAENGGQQCPAESSLIERIPCNQQACAPPQDCVVEQAYWSPCRATVPCKPGIQTRQLTIVKQSLNGGLPCPRSLVQTRSCELPKDQQLPCQRPQPQPFPQPQPQPGPFQPIRPRPNLFLVQPARPQPTFNFGYGQ